MLACLEYCFILDERLHLKKFLVLQDYETLNGERSCCCFKQLNKIQTFQLNEIQRFLTTANCEIKNRHSFFSAMLFRVVLRSSPFDAIAPRQHRVLCFALTILNQHDCVIS